MVDKNNDDQISSYRHYHPGKNYYSSPNTIKSLRKKSLRITFINVIAILLVALLTKFITSSNKFTHKESTNYQLTVKLIAHQAHITLKINPKISPNEILPINLEFSWNKDNPFIQYLIIDDTFFDYDNNVFIISHTEPAMKGSILYATIVENMSKPTIIISKVE